MIRILVLSVVLAFFPSCDIPDGRTVVLDIPSFPPIASILSESPFYDLLCFDGYKVRHLFVQKGTSEVSIRVRRGSLVLFVLTPFGEFSPLASWFQPGMSVPSTFSFGTASTVRFLIDVAERNPGLVSSLSFSDLIRDNPDGDSIDRRKLLDALENGNLSGSSDLAAKKFPVVVETYLHGRWSSDRDDIPDFWTTLSGGPAEIWLYEGFYRFFHENGEHMLVIAVSSDGSSITKLSLIPIFS